MLHFDWVAYRGILDAAWEMSCAFSHTRTCNKRWYCTSARWTAGLPSASLSRCLGYRYRCLSAFTTSTLHFCRANGQALLSSLGRWLGCQPTLTHIYTDAARRLSNCRGILDATYEMLRVSTLQIQSRIHHTHTHTKFNYNIDVTDTNIFKVKNWCIGRENKKRIMKEK
jgi:hypothetical protein